MTRKPRRRTVATKRPVSTSRSKPAPRTASKTKPQRADAHDAFIAAAAKALDLPTRKAWLPAIKANLKNELMAGAESK